MKEIEITRKFKKIEFVLIDSIDDVQFIAPYNNIIKISYNNGQVYIDDNNVEIWGFSIFDKESFNFAIQGKQFPANSIILINSSDIFVIVEIIKKFPSFPSFFNRFCGDYEKSIFVINEKPIFLKK